MTFDNFVCSQKHQDGGGHNNIGVQSADTLSVDHLVALYEPTQSQLLWQERRGVKEDNSIVYDINNQV